MPRLMSSQVFTNYSCRIFKSVLSERSLADDRVSHKAGNSTAMNSNRFRIRIFVCQLQARRLIDVASSSIVNSTVAVKDRSVYRASGLQPTWHLYIGLLDRE
jgi:hypothetical protein